MSAATNPDSAKQPETTTKNDPILPLTGDDWENVYEPVEDSFLFVDALQAEMDTLQQMKPRIVLELGCGSGFVTAYLAKQLKGAAYYASDINPYAVSAAERTFRANNLDVQMIQSDLLESWQPKNNIDVLLFNPPYVPTDKDEMESSLIARSWAGGDRGREVVDRVFQNLEKYLAPSGCMYVVALDANDPHEIAKWMGEKGYRTKVVKKRNSDLERLLILKIFKG